MSHPRVRMVTIIPLLQDSTQPVVQKIRTRLEIGGQMTKGTLVCGDSCLGGNFFRGTAVQGDKCQWDTCQGDKCHTTTKSACARLQLLRACTCIDLYEKQFGCHFLSIELKF